MIGSRSSAVNSVREGVCQVRREKFYKESDNMITSRSPAVNSIQKGVVMEGEVN